MIFSRYVDKLVQNSESFSFQAYCIGLQRYVKAKSRSGELGSIQCSEVNPFFKEENPVSLILGETNRMVARYPLICSLLELDLRSAPQNTDYYRALWRYYAEEGFIARFKGRLEIRRKIDRIYRMHEYIKTNKNLEGVHSYLTREPERRSRHDYPINLVNDIHKFENVIQLDGSHRRCICYYNGISMVASINTKLSDTISHIDKYEEPYLHHFSGSFLSVLKCLNV